MNIDLESLLAFFIYLFNLLNEYYTYIPIVILANNFFIFLYLLYNYFFVVVYLVFY